MMSGHQFVLAALLVVIAPSVGLAVDTCADLRYGNPRFGQGKDCLCHRVGCSDSCPAGMTRTVHGGCPALGGYANCCELKGSISQPQKRKSPNSANVSKADPLPKYTPKYQSPPSPKVTKGSSWPKYTPKYQFPTSAKVPASAKVTKAAPRPASGYRPKNQFPGLYGSPLR